MYIVCRPSFYIVYFNISWLSILRQVAIDSLIINALLLLGMQINRVNVTINAIKYLIAIKYFNRKKMRPFKFDDQSTDRSGKCSGVFRKRNFCLATCFGLPKVRFTMPNFTSTGSKRRLCGANSWKVGPLVKTIPLCISRNAGGN